MENSWYHLIDSAKANISQGDILFNCPIVSNVFPTKDGHNEIDFNAIGEQTVKTQVLRANIVVMNQSCDLEVRGNAEAPKLTSVLVALLEDVRKSELGKKRIEDVSKLDYNQLFLLEASHDQVYMGPQVVHFDALFTLPWKLIDAYSKQQNQHLRLKNPYLEQLSQHFGNYFSRVALPGDRSDSIRKYYSFKSEYEELRRLDNKMKLWRELSEQEIYEFIQKDSKKD